MINRRGTFRALFGCVAARFTCCGVVSGGPVLSGASTANPAACSLTDLLRLTIEVCRNRPAATEFQGLFEHALFRVHEVPYNSPAFWQSCVDALRRLDVVLSREENSDLPEAGQTRLTRYQSGSLRNRLEDRTVQAIGRLQPD